MMGRRRREAELLEALARIEQLLELQVKAQAQPGTSTSASSCTPEAPRDRILWNRRPKNVSDTGDIDEIVAHNVTVHIEQMDDRCWWIGITWPDGSYWAGNFYATKKGKMTFGEQDYREGGWPTDEEHGE